MTTTNHPNYYSRGGIEAIDIIEAYGLNFNLANVIKYVTSAGRKDGKETLTALQNAERFLNREIQKLMEKAETPF